MTIDDFSKLQADWRLSALSSLVRDCVTRYCNAAFLVNVWGDEFDKVSEAWKEPVDLTPLFPLWDKFCVDYRNYYYTNQIDFFQGDVEKWSQFIHWRLFPKLLRSDYFVRTLLQAVGLLRCESPKDAGTALLTQIPYGAFTFESNSSERWEQ